MQEKFIPDKWDQKADKTRWYRDTVLDYFY